MSSNVLVPPSPHYPIAQLSYKDRRPWLIVFGIGLILIGCLQLLAAALMAAMPLITRNVPQGAEAPTLGVFVAIGIFYALIAAVFIAMGVGSIMAKNWARIGSLVLSWIWLVMGVLVTLMSAAVLPAAIRAAEQQRGSAGQPFQVGFMVGYLGVLTVFLVAMPLVYVIFYSTRNVRETCLAASGARPFAPGSVLCTILGIWLLLSVPGVLISFFTSPVALVFGVIMRDTPATLLMVLIAMVNVIAGWGLLRRDIRGWWAAIVSTGFWAVSGIISVFATDMAEFVREVTPPESTFPLSLTFMRGTFIAGVVFALAMFGLILYSRRYFPPLHPPGRMAASTT